MWQLLPDVSIMESWVGFCVVSGYLSPLPHTLLITVTVEKWPFQHHNPSHSISATGNVQGEAGRQQELHSSSHPWCIKVCKEFKAPFHLLSLWNASSLDYKWQPHLHVEAEVKLHIHSGTCQRRESPLFDNCSADSRHRPEPLPKIHITCGQEHGFQGTESQQVAVCNISHPLERFPSRRGWTLLAGCKHAQTQVLLSGNFYFHCPRKQSN